MAEPRNDNESSSKVPLHEQDPEKYSGSSDSSEDEIDGENQEDLIRQMLQMKLHQGKSRTNEDLGKKKVLDEVSFDGLIRHVKSGKVKNIITMAGAGISTSAGIPDFRSPETGLYNNLQEYDLPNPQAIFDIEYFEERPEPFFQLAKELYPGQFEPTPCHYFIKLLEQKGLLLRHYTQNIDTLERVANISGDKLVEAHGTFHSSHCIEPKCRKEYTQEWMKEQIMKDVIPTCKECNSVVKPDIVFFGEQLPDRFYSCLVDDFKICDLLIIMGTSLTVQPFANLVDRVSLTTPRLLINLTRPPFSGSDYVLRALGRGGLDLSEESGYRDVAKIGTCDQGCQDFVKAMGWEDEFQALLVQSKSEAPSKP